MSIKFRENVRGRQDKMKKALLKLLCVSIVVFICSIFMVSPHSADAKKGKKKMTEEEITAITNTVNTLTKKVYSGGLFSPQDNDSLIDVKIKVDDAFMVNPTSLDFAQLYYKLGRIELEREYRDDAIECFQSVLDNYSDSPYASKALNELKKMGVKIQNMAGSATQ